MANPKDLSLLENFLRARSMLKTSQASYAIDLRGADLQGVSLRDINLQSIDLRGALLEDCDFEQTKLFNANLGSANLTRANLAEADLRRALLQGCNLEQARLVNANLTSANLTRANLRGADLRGANLQGALLKHSNLSDAILGDTIFAKVDLGEVDGLATCRHEGPSSLDFATLSSSTGIPGNFLLGSGLPQVIIDYLPSLISQPTPLFYSCFISYSAKDEGFARKLYSDLQGLGIRAWYAPQELRVGQSIQEQIESAIRVHDKLVLVLSKESIQSHWVQYEVKKALKAEDETQRTVLFPVKLDDSIFNVSSSWATELRQHFILDFSNWKEKKAYQTSLSGLVKDLSLTAALEMPRRT